MNQFRLTPVFSGLEEELLLDVARASRARSLSPGQALVRKGEPAYGFFLVVSGSVSLRTAEDRVLAMVLPGETFAEGTLVAHRHYPVDARAEKESRIVVIDRRRFLEIMGRRPDLALRVMEAMGRRMRCLTEKWSRQRSRGSENLVIQWLLARITDRSAIGAQVIRVPATKKLLAAELGITPETLSRCLAHLRDRELVRIRGRSVEVLDLVGLRRAEKASCPAIDRNPGF